MPKKTKETNEITIEPVKSTKKRTTSTEKADSKSVAKSTTHKTSSKAATKSTSKSSKNSTAKSNVKKTSSKTAATKTSSKTTTAKKTSSKSTKSDSKTTSPNSKDKVKASKTSKKTSVKTDSSTKRISKKVANSKKGKAAKVVEKTAIIEYYDLPYRYNKTMVKVLAQTPTTLFVYWDISDEDKKGYVKQYGDYFFYDTKPVLLVHNSTMNYSYEIDINDYANSWYIHVPDANCDYEIELGRRPINEYSKINDYLGITSSNDIIAPNDHILFEELTNNVYFRNLKTNVTTRKDISISFLTKIGKIYNVQDFYENLYKDEVFSFDRLNLKNLPSS